MELAETFKLLQNIIHDMANAPDGISTGDIVKKYGIGRRNVPKYISILEYAGLPIYVERKRYYLDKDYFAAFTLTPDESEFLFLVLERSLTYHSDRWRTMQSLLHKLGSKMTLPLADTLLHQHDPDQPNDPGDKWFSLLAQAKRDRLEVWVFYHPLNRREARQWLIRPFRFVSNPLSDGIYVLCEGTRDGDSYIPLSLKFDRILDVQITENKFEISELARFTSYHGRAWGVWNSEREPVEVLLQFEPRHYDRLLETIWHPTQSISVGNDGFVYFSVSVSETQEMIPWIRSWGSGVVVLEPPELRQRTIWSLQRQLRAYGIAPFSIGDEEVDFLPYLWAKYERKSGAYHCLLYHLLDVAAVAWVMWDRTLSNSQRSWLMDLLGVDAHSAQICLSLLAGLHDIGKATPGFQRKVKMLFDRLIEMGLTDDPYDEPHGVLSAIILKEKLSTIGFDGEAAHLFAAVIGGHHGVWIPNSSMRRHKRSALGGQKWLDLQSQLFETMQNLFAVPNLTLSDNANLLNQLLVFVSGFISVCDWIGSNDTYFPYEIDIIEPGIYFERALAQAETALSEMGWFGWFPPGDQVSFEAMFPFKPNAMQEAAIQKCDFSSGSPRLILVEYLTGGGKTELALHLADQLVNWLGQAGVYIAMPTQATSNQMFKRVSDYLEARYPQQAINVQLIHSQADQHPLYQELLAAPERDGDESSLVAPSWFQNRKRSLLAPFAVGTVDQAMMSVIQTRHHFVRQYGLSHKTVIFDEVHAYDTYMNAIIERLLSWLMEMQSPVILLSATLSRHNRNALLDQVGADVESVQDVPYPRLTIVEGDGTVNVHPLPAPVTRVLRLQRIGPNLGVLSAWITPIYQQGGCIAIICNTVDESISVAREFISNPEIDDADVLLFHARFPPQWRNSIEERVLDAFSKEGQRPQRMILVATQIIEQSLDLDFDLIVSSFAPIDLLIQRAGRLHRHSGRQRPSHLTEPILVLREPEMDGILPDFGVDELIYERFTLLKTWLLLQGRDNLAIPDEIDEVMDFVYAGEAVNSEEDSPYVEALRDAWDQMTMGNNGAAFRGKTYCIAAPNDEFLVGNTSFDLPDDEQVRISTRDMRPGIDIVCLRGPNSDLPLPSSIDRPPKRDEIRSLLRYRVTIYNKKLMEALKTIPENTHWSWIPQLRSARIVVFEGEIARIPNSLFILRLSQFYGLEIVEESV